MPKPFFSTCVDWPSICKMHFESDDILALEELISEGEDISLQEFVALVDPSEWRALQENLGYDLDRGQGGMMIEDDLCVSYSLDRASGVPFMVHSRIEHVFATPDDIAGIFKRAKAREELEMDLR